MTFYSKESKPFGFIVYSSYGLMSHVVMNEYGVVYACNPIIDDKGKCVVYPTKESAQLAKTDFHKNVAEVILITKFENDKFVNFREETEEDMATLADKETEFRNEG